jgi:hypothetical protein
MIAFVKTGGWDFGFLCGAGQGRQGRETHPLLV